MNNKLYKISIIDQAVDFVMNRNKFISFYKYTCMMYPEIRNNSLEKAKMVHTALASPFENEHDYNISMGIMEEKFNNLCDKSFIPKYLYVYKDYHGTYREYITDTLVYFDYDLTLQNAEVVDEITDKLYEEKIKNYFSKTKYNELVIDIINELKNNTIVVIDAIVKLKKLGFTKEQVSSLIENNIDNLKITPFEKEFVRTLYK